MQKIDIVIPVYNEEKVLYSVLENLLKIKIWNLILVNDGSTDNTNLVANKFNITILNHDKNYGQGAALRTGIMHSMKNNSDYVCTFDADGQHDVNDLLKMVNFILKNENTDAVLGSRFIENKSDIPAGRNFLLKIAVIFSNIVFGGKFTDVHNGLRVFKTNSVKKINFSADGMEHASLITESIVQNKLKYHEMPVKVLYTRYSVNKGQKLSNLITLGLKLIYYKFAKRRW